MMMSIALNIAVASPARARAQLDRRRRSKRFFRDPDGLTDGRTNGSSS